MAYVVVTCCLLLQVDIVDSFADIESSWLKYALAADRGPRDDYLSFPGDSPLHFTAPHVAAGLGFPIFEDQG